MVDWSFGEKGAGSMLCRIDMIPLRERVRELGEGDSRLCRWKACRMIKKLEERGWRWVVTMGVTSWLSGYADYDECNVMCVC